mgnify:FL=1
MDEEGDGDDTSIIDINKQKFQFEGHKFLAFFVEKAGGYWDVWVKGRDVAEYLGYKNPSESINDNVDKENILKLCKLIKLYPPSEKLAPKSLDKKTIFINLSGFFNLIHFDP